MKSFILFLGIFSTFASANSSNVPEFYTRATAHLCYANDIDQELKRAFQSIQLKADKVCKLQEAIKVTDFQSHKSDSSNCIITFEAGYICVPKESLANSNGYCHIKPGKYIIECCDGRGSCWFE